MIRCRYFRDPRQQDNFTNTTLLSLFILLFTTRKNKEKRIIHCCVYALTSLFDSLNFQAMSLLQKT